MSQSQKGGSDSVNIQIGNIQAGLTYSDVRDIAQDIFDKNFSQISTEARKIADERANELRNDFISALSKEPAEVVDSFSQPDKQLSLLEAQKSYAISGDADLKSALVKAVVEIGRQQTRNLKSIVLNEALKIIPNLTSNQIHLLAISFFFRYVSYGLINSIDELDQVLIKILPNYNEITAKDGDFRHLEYLGCGKMQIASVNLENALTQTYPGLLQRGQTLDELNQLFFGALPNGIISINAPNLFQIAALNANGIDIKGNENNWTEEQKNIAKKNLKDRCLNEAEIKIKITNLSAIKKLMPLWNDSELKNFTLSSVGIAIAHSHITGSDINFSDLNVWL